MSEQGHLVPPLWLEANGFTPESWQRLVDDFSAKAHGPVQLLTPLPRKVRAKLWLASRIDGAAIWLVEHNRLGLAEALWRACRMR